MTFFADLLTALRGARRRPFAALAAAAFLACGLGVAAGVFAVADKTLWQPLPLPEAERLVWVQSVDRGLPGDSSPGLVQAWVERARTVEALGALRPVQATWRDRAGIDRLEGAQVTAGAVQALGLRAARGRLLTPEDGRAGALPVAVVTHRLWTTRFGRADGIIGLEVDIDGRARTIVGVLPPAADQLPFGGDWFIPLTLTDGPSGTGPRYLDVVARLAPGSTSAAAERELVAIANALGAAGDDGAPLAVQVRPLSDAFAAGAARVLQPLLAAALAVWLIATVNTASLRLAEQQQRQGELAVRAALGASRWRLLSQQLAESVVVTAAAGAGGLLVAQWCIAGLEALLPVEILQRGPVHVDARAAGFAALLALAVVAVAGLLPALRVSGSALAGGMLAQARTLVAGDDRLRRAFVAAQIALAMTLGTAGLVMVQTTRALADAAGPARAEHVWTAALRLGATDFPAASDITASVGRIVERVGALPGASRVAVASRVPLSGGAPGSDVALVGEPFSAGVDRQTRIRFVTPGYFAAVDTPVLQGRDLAETDGAGREPVVLVNETLAARLTPGRSPVGESVRFAVRDFNEPAATTWRIVGLVADAKDRGPRQPSEPEIYLSLAQGPAPVFDWIGRQLLLVVRTEPGRVLAPATLRAAVSAADPRVPAFDVRTLEARFARHISTERLLAGLLAPLGAMGLLLAAFGVFALVLHAVHVRRREIALRMVLGAAPSDVVREAGRRVAAVTAAGLAAGILGAAVAARVLASVSFGVTALDPGVLAALASTVAVMTLLAVWIPARRAARQDPAVVLRAE